MSLYAVIATGNNVVNNIIVWDGHEQWGPGKGYTAVEIKKGQACNMGYVYDKETGEFTEPASE